MLDPQTVIQWMNDLYASNETLTNEMLEEFPALAELIFAGDAATVEQLQAALEEWQNKVDDTTKAISDAYNQGKASENNYYDTASTFDLIWFAEGWDKAIEHLKAQSEDLGVDLVSELAKAYPVLQEVIAGVKDADDAYAEFAQQLNLQHVRNLEELHKAMEGTVDAIDNANVGAIEFAGSEQKLTSEARKLAEAQRALGILQNASAHSVEQQEEAMATLASYTGYTADELRGNLAPAEEFISIKAGEVSGTIQALTRYLASLGAVNIGAGNVNSQIQSIADTAGGAIGMIARLILSL